MIGQNFYDLSSRGLNHFGGAISLNLWHGVPWKRIGHDANNRSGFHWTLYNRIFDIAHNATYMTSQADIFDEIWRSGFGVSPEFLIKTGLPRNERLFDIGFQERSRAKVIDFLGCKSDANVIAYLSTFRDRGEGVFSFSNPIHKDQIADFLNATNSVIVEKNHFASTYEKSGNNASGDGRFSSGRLGCAGVACRF